jgi:hypothetical protein
MNQLQELEQKIRQAIPELREEWEIFEEGAIDRDMITQIGLNHVLWYFGLNYKDNPLFFIIGNDFFIARVEDNLIKIKPNKESWNLKSAYLKDQSPELINFLNELK